MTRSISFVFFFCLFFCFFFCLFFCLFFCSCHFHFTAMDFFFVRDKDMGTSTGREWKSGVGGATGTDGWRSLNIFFFLCYFFPFLCESSSFFVSSTTYSSLISVYESIAFPFLPFFPFFCLCLMCSNLPFHSIQSVRYVWRLLLLYYYHYDLLTPVSVPTTISFSSYIH